MITRPKSLKSMGDDEWMVRLRAFASSGVWPSGGGNRPAPRQRKWHDLYQKVKYRIACLPDYLLLITYSRDGKMGNTMVEMNINQTKDCTLG